MRLDFNGSALDADYYDCRDCGEHAVEVTSKMRSKNKGKAVFFLLAIVELSSAAVFDKRLHQIRR